MGKTRSIVVAPAGLPANAKAWSRPGRAVTRRVRVAAFMNVAVLISACSGSSPAQTPLPTPTPAPAYALEPNEAWIVYQAGHGTRDTIWLARDDGTDSHVLGGNPPGAINEYHPDWSPDGQTIAYTEEYFGSKDIWLVNADGTNPRVLAEHTAEMPFLDLPAFSPDGSQIAAASYSDEPTFAVSSRSAIVLIDVATGRSTEISVLEGSHRILAYPRWAPSGDAFVVTVGQFDDAGTTWLGEALAVIRRNDGGWSEPEIITDFAGFASYPDWNPAGDLIVFTAADRGWFINIVNNTAGNAVDLSGITPDLFTIRPDGTELTQITHATTAGADWEQGQGSGYGQPSWTRDGHIIFTYTVGPHDNRAALINADGSGLTELGVSVTHPRLRPLPSS